MEFKLINVLKIILHQARSLFYLSIFTGIICSIVVLFLIESKYESQAKFIVVSNSGSNSQASNLANIASGFGLSLPIDGSSSVMSENIYPTLIKSENLLENLLFKSFTDYHYNSEKKLIDMLITVDVESDFEKKKNALKILQEDRIKVSKDPKTGVIILTVLSNHGLLSRDICLAILEELDILQQNINTRNAKEKRIFIKDRITEVELNLYDIEKDLIDFYNSHKLYQSSPMLLVEEQRIKTKLDVAKSVYITLKQEFETAKIEEVNESSFIELIDGPSVPLYRSSPKRKIFVIYWTLVVVFLASFILFIKDSKKLLRQNDLDELRELKSIIKRQFK